MPPDAVNALIGAAGRRAVLDRSVTPHQLRHAFGSNLVDAGGTVDALQALVSATSYAMPKRMANGVDLNRVSLLLAVMEKRLGMHLSGQDVYVNVVGGMRIDEPAIDLGIVVAVTSSLREVVVEPGLLVLGEVGLGGEVRGISQAELRIREAAKMGFKRCLLPERNLAKLDAIEGMDLVGISEVGEALDVVLA
jgi:DNA repair protein RadA/Sms